MPSARAADATPYVLKSTDVVDVRATQLKRDYQLFVSLPPSYEKSARRYPVVFVTDADYAFPLIRSMARRLGTGSHGVEEFILVGLSYAKGDTPEYSRRRDYTPSDTAEKGRVSDMPGRAPKFGESEGYRRFIKDEVFPVIAQRYRADMERKVFAGHSYGSLLGLHIAFTEPAMFSHYILGSPSLWYGKRVMFAREKAYAASHKDLDAKFYFSVGGFETFKPGSRDTRYNTDEDMVADLLEFEALLKKRQYPGLKMETAILADEDHLSVAPVIITRGLKWALPSGKR
ncbi:alpha/beta hydrolase [Massilia sp. R798]|uniref:Alpha/beta hydrolase n=2 Tax=Massilia soli TaxID=2792854 RepID=A0ABS7SS43_9BURK|nr:alpha/beta hydrolase [Massilia soli]